MKEKNNLFGLVLCGGKSTRMGFDKSKLTYSDIPIRYYLYAMLENLCDKVFISCNSNQLREVDKDYNTLVDYTGYDYIGPMAALLTAFERFPENNFLVIGCDYPFIKETDLKKFLSSDQNAKPAAAFYNKEKNLYEPVLAYYKSECAESLLKLYWQKNYSLQYFLKSVDAEKYIPYDLNIIKSVNTTEEFTAARDALRKHDELLN